MQTGVSLQPYNTLGIDVQAEYFVELQSPDECLELPGLCIDRPVLVLGGGSNLVLAGDVEGLVILNRLRGIQKVQQDKNCVLVRAAGGENWDRFVEYTLTQGWFGLENLSAIPGSVGAAPVQNIGAYGVELKDLLHSVDVMFLADGRCQQLANAQCRFDYRDSIFKSSLQDQCLITHVTFKLSLTPDLKLDYGEIRGALQAAGLDAATVTPLQVRQIVTDVRARKLPDPVQLPNVGSFFKNPVVSRSTLLRLQQRWPDLVHYPLAGDSVKLAAGWLLDRLGWKGRCVGQACVHERQALVLINHSRDASDLLCLKDRIQRNVREQTGIELEMEPRIIGLRE